MKSNTIYNLIKGKSSLKIFFIFFFAVFIISCKETFDDDISIGNQKILVVSGAITSDPGPYKLKLYYASPYGSSKTESVGGATVVVYDNMGNKAKFKDKTGGVYMTEPADIVGIPGRKYYIQIILPKPLGLVYESKPQMLEEKRPVDSLYAEPGTMETTTTTSDGSLLRKTFQGIYVYADVNYNTDQTHYFRFSNKVVWQYVRSMNPGNGMPYPVYLRQVFNTDNVPNIKSTQEYNGFQVVKKHKLFFLAYRVDNQLGIDTATLMGPFMSYGWVVYASIYHISNDSYKFYKDAVAQLSSGLQLFDPIPSQVRSNIVCKSDSTVQALGLFEVYSLTKMYKGFHWWPGTTVKTADITDPGPLLNDTSYRAPQPYWVSFY